MLNSRRRYRCLYLLLSETQQSLGSQALYKGKKALYVLLSCLTPEIEKLGLSVILIKKRLFGTPKFYRYLKDYQNHFKWGQCGDKIDRNDFETQKRVYANLRKPFIYLVPGARIELAQP